MTLGLQLDPSVDEPAPDGSLLDKTLFRCTACGVSVWVASCVNPYDTVKAARNLGLRVNDRFDTVTGRLLDDSVLCAKCNVSARNVAGPLGRHRRGLPGQFRSACSRPRC